MPSFLFLLPRALNESSFSYLKEEEKKRKERKRGKRYCQSDDARKMIGRRESLCPPCQPQEKGPLTMEWRERKAEGLACTNSPRNKNVPKYASGLLFCARLTPRCLSYSLPFFFFKGIERKCFEISKGQGLFHFPHVF